MTARAVPSVPARLANLVRESDGRDHATIFVGDQRLHAVVAGEGPLVLLAHGFPETSLCWRRQIDDLAASGYRVVAPDMRGYGRSGKPAGVAAYTVLQLVADCVGVVEALGESTAVIAGHDWGSMVAWTAAWTRPDVFRAVAGMSVAFGGRGLIPIAGIDSFGERRPSDVHRAIAGPNRLFYQEYWAKDGALEAEFETDPRGYLRDQYFTFSAGPYVGQPQAPDPLAADVATIAEQIRGSGTCLAPTEVMRDRLVTPTELPDWLADDLDLYTAEFERAGLEAPLNWYRAMDRSWDELAPFDGQPITVPAIFIGGDRDAATLWSAESVAAFDRTVPHHHESVVLSECGHWFTRERPAETSAALLGFLSRL